MNNLVRITGPSREDEKSVEVFNEIARKHDLGREKMIDCDERFLNAWKEGVMLIGPRFFQQNSKKDVYLATNKNDLRPDYEYIQSHLDHLNHCRMVLLFLMVSFFNSGKGAQYFRETGLNFGVAECSYYLDPRYRSVLSELVLNYSGW